MIQIFSCSSTDLISLSLFLFLTQGVVRDSAGYAVMLKWTMSNIYGLSPGDVRQHSTTNFSPA